MKVYKVSFENNRAVAARLQGYIFGGGFEMDRIDGRRVLRSLSVVADSEGESVLVATVFVRDYLKFLKVG